MAGPGGDRRERLLDGLESIFFLEGVSGVSVDLLAQRLKCSKRTLYQIGANKRDMALTVLARWSERITEAAIRGMAETSPAERLSAFLTPGVAESRRISSQLLKDVSQDRLLDQAFKAHQRRRVAGLAALLGEGIEAGVYRRVNVDLVAALCLGAIDRIDDPATLELSGVDFGTAFETFYGVLMDGLRQTPTAG